MVIMIHFAYSTFTYLKFLARPCDAHGTFLPPGSVPEPLSEKTPDDWTPFRNRTEFETAEFFFIKNQTPATQINRLLDLWASTLTKHNDRPPFADYRDLYKTIDNIPVGDVKWQSFSTQYTGTQPDIAPPWMDQTFDVGYRDPHQVVRNMLGNPDYAQEFDYRPYREFSTDGDVRQWKDFMSADWAWNQAVSTTVYLRTTSDKFFRI
jgi:hypothetical protein